MDYLHFLDEYDTYNEWNQVNKKWKKEDRKLDRNDGIRGAFSPDTISFDDIKNPYRFPPNNRSSNPMVDSPSHYTRGRKEVIDVIEDAIKDAPSAIYGMLQGQSLKYILRMWSKENSRQDAQKAIWYLERLIAKLDERDDS